MGYFIKKGIQGNEGLALPSGTTAQRPATPIESVMRYNTDINSIEYYDGTQFVGLAKAGLADLSIDNFVGDNVATTFTPMAFAPPGAKHIFVFINGNYQTPSTNYTVSGFDITFTSAPPSGEAITIIHGLSSTIVSNIVVDVPSL